MAARKSSRRLEVIIITGLSGAGKSQAIHCFEDMGYFCIDNLPASLIPKVADLLILPGTRARKVALVVDVRSAEFFDRAWDALRELKAKRIEYRILYLEASNDALVKRFKETRRRHPLAKGGDIVDGIDRERMLLASFREAADFLIDTTGMAPQELRNAIRSDFMAEVPSSGLSITVLSFGFKYGLPMDADLVFDVRFLPNPHYVESLTRRTGEDARVSKFVLERPETRTFLNKMESLLNFLMPHYAQEGKTHLAVAFGCTGGTHRSVVLAREIQAFLRDKGYKAILRHRDMGREFTEETGV